MENQIWIKRARTSTFSWLSWAWTGNSWRELPATKPTLCRSLLSMKIGWKSALPTLKVLGCSRAAHCELVK